MNINTRNMNFVNYNGQEMDWVKFNGDLVYENFKTLTSEGVPPLTLNKCKNTDMLGYKVYGQSKQQILPDGYTQLEYIRATGTQYIDTGVAYDDTSIEVNFVGTIETNSTLFGIRKTGKVNNTFKVSSVNNKIRASIYSENYTSDLSMSSSIIYNFILNNNVFNVDGTTLYSFSTSAETSNFNLYLFAENVISSDGNSSTAEAKGSAKCYTCKIYKNDVLVRHFVPCKNQSNVIGLYDLINDTFYQNAGTGTFTAGTTAPTPNAPVEIESVGTHTNNYFDTKKVSRFNYDITVENDSISITGGYQTIVNFKPYDLKPNTTYTMKYHLSRTQAASTVQGRVRFAKSDNSTSIAVINNGDASNLELDLIGTFTTPSDIREYTRMWFYSGTGTTEFKNIQVVEGTYTMATMPDYESYGYNIPVTVRSQNLFNAQQIATDSNIPIIDGKYLRCRDFYEGFAKINAPFKENTQYTLKIKAVCQNDELSAVQFWAFYTDGTSSRLFLGQVDSSHQEIELIGTTTAGKTVDYIDSHSNFYATYYLVEIEGSQLVEGAYTSSTIPAYEPYVAPRTTNIYLREPLRKLGNYADYIDFENQKVYRNIQQNYYDGISSGQVVNFISRVYDDYVRFVAGSFSPANMWSLNVEKCNYLPYSANQTPDCLTVGGNSGPSLFLYNTTVGITADDDTNAKRIAKANAWLQSLFPVLQIAYVLATPIEENITLPDILLNKGTNIVDVDTSVTPSNMWIKYKGKGGV